MSDEQKQAVLRRVMEEGFGQGNEQVIDELVAPDEIEHQSNIRPANRDGVKACIRMLHAAFPDFRLAHQHTAVQGDLVWSHYSATGTQTGFLGPFPPTGKKMKIDVFDLARVENGKIVEHWGVPDLLGQLEQLGLLPQRDAAGR